MADAAAGLEEVGNALLGYEAPYLGVIGGVQRRRRRHGVVQRDRQPLRVFDAVRTQVSEDARNRRRVIVAQHHIRRHVYDLTGDGGRQTGGAG